MPERQVGPILEQMSGAECADHRQEMDMMIDATYLEAHRTASSLGVKKAGRGRQSAEPKAA